MLVAVEGKSEIPTIGEVTAIEPNPTLESKFSYITYQQDKKSVHKPKWLRYFSKTTSTNDAKLRDIILYDFHLTKMGAIRKATREFFTRQS